MKKLGKLLYLGIILLFLYFPIGALMVLSFNDGKSMNSWQGFSLRWYEEMLGNAEIMEALGNTLTIALWASIIATVVGVLGCLGLNAMSEKKRSFIMGLNNIPLLNADIVIGISIMLCFLLFGISLSYGTVLFAHITFCLPYVILSVMPKFKQLQNLTYEAALDLGATPVYAFFKVVLPEIMPGIVSGFLLSFTMSVDDFVITHFTRGAGINTLSTLIYSQVKVGVRPTLFALSTIIFVTVLLVLIIVNVLSSRSEKRGSTGMSNRRMVAIMMILVVAMVGSIKFTFFGNPTPNNGELYVYCFGDYFDPELVQEFEEKTGYKVTVDYFDTNEEMYPVIKNNSVQYDVICASDYMIEKLLSEDLLAELNYENIPNAVNITDNIKPFMEGFDPGMKHSVPFTWGTYGIMYNKNMITTEIDSWEDLWDKTYDGKIVMPNSLREGYMIAAKSLGYSINTTNEDEIQEMTDLLVSQKPLVYSFANDSARELMIGESAALAVVNSGEVIYSKDANDNLGFVIPKEGTEVWTDCWAIPKTVANKEAAEAWINFFLDGYVAEVNFEYLTYAIPNKEIQDLIEEPVLNPSEDVLKKSETLKNLGVAADAMYSRYWKEYKAK